jgi:WD40 repeat protein
MAIASRTEVIIWDVAANRELRRIAGRGGQVAWNPAGNLLATGDLNQFNVWDLDGEEPVASFSGQSFGAVAWSPVEPRLAVVAGHKVIKLVSLATESEVVNLRGHRSRVTTLSWRPGGSLLATGCIDGEVRIWRTEKTPELASGAASVSWSPDGSQYVRAARQPTCFS